MKLFRKILFWCHLVTGVAVALIVLVMSVTGVLLTYQLQMTYLADTHNLDATAPSDGAQRMGAGALLAALEASGEGRPSSIRWNVDPDEPAIASFGREKTLYVNAYSGQVLGGQTQGIRDFFRSVEDWHRWLAMEGEGRETGKAITGASNLGFLFLVLSGLYLWWPRNWRKNTVMAVTWFRSGLSPRARDFNWHNVIGFWSVIPLVAIVATATVFSYPWANDLVFILAGEEPPQRRGGRPGPPRGNENGQEEAPASAFTLDESLYSSLEGLISPVSERVADWRTLTLTTPADENADLRLQVDAGSGRQPHKQATLVVDRATGSEVSWESFEQRSAGSQARSIVRFLHTGEVLGFWGQTLAGLVSLGSVLLVWTGLSLSLRRFWAWKKRTKKVAPRAEPVE